MAYSLADIKKKLDEDIPALSPTASKVIMLANDINCQAADLTRAVKLDPVLAAKVLRLVNSSYYSLGAKIVSLERAVIMLGLNTIKNLALSSAVLAVMSPGRGNHPFAGDQYWRHCLGVGTAAKMIAEMRRVPRTETDGYFIAGLLHDLGILAEARLFLSEMEKIAELGSRTGLLAAEEALLGGLNHCLLGGLLARKWGLSPDLSAAMALHHDPPGEGEHRELCQTVYLANIICKNQGVGMVLDRVPILADPAVLEGLGLDAGVERIVSQDLDDAIADAMEFLTA